MDSQVIELIGRNKLISELLRAGLEVALPQRDRGIDLIVYLDIAKDGRFIMKPIQMKVASKQSFGLNRKYSKFHDLILVYVWNLSDPNLAVTYALTYREVFKIIKKIGWTKTKFWKNKWNFITNSPSNKLVGLLEPYKMDSEKWQNKIRA